MTMDVDLVTAMHQGLIPKFVSLLSTEFYADAGMIESALRANRAFNLIHTATVYKFDIFPLTDDPFALEQMSRRQIREVVVGTENIEVPVATAEDTILAKLDWYRSGGGVSERQLNDVRGVMAVQRERLDLAYLRKWAQHLRVADLLEQMLSLTGL